MPTPSRSPTRSRVVLAALIGSCSWASAASDPKVYQALLQKYVGADGSVDYGRWHQTPADVAALDQHVSGLLQGSPLDQPKLYGSTAEQLGYWLNLYNALVLREIIRRWPMSSVTQADAGTGAKGFFQDLKFAVGARKLSLDEIEKEILRARFKDPRIHFAINCGARSCPLLNSQAFLGSQLEAQLDSATRAFINQKANVEVDDATKTVRLSAIFDWYQEDFIAAARQRDPQAGLIDFLIAYTGAELGRSLTNAKGKGYRLAFLAYDWAVNDLPSGAAPGLRPGVGQSVPDIAFALRGGGTFRPSQARGKVLLLDFWASFCKPCRATFPWLEALHQKHGDQLVVVGVSEDSDPEAVAAFVKATGATFAIGMDAQNAAAGPPWGIVALPVELLIDRKGTVRFRHEGIAKGELETLAREVELLLRER